MANDKSDNERWRSIPDYPGYEVSDRGRVRSYYAQNGKAWHIAKTPQRILSPTRVGYKKVSLQHKNGERHIRHVAHLVLLAFKGDCPDGMEVCHNDNNKHNNCLDNLRYDTHFNNMQDSVGMKKSFPGRKLTKEDVLAIRKKYNEGTLSRAELAQEFNISQAAISSVCTGRTYKWCGGPLTRRWNEWTSDTVLEVRQKRVNGASLKNLADEYGTSIYQISKICTGNRYPDMPGPLTEPWQISVRE